MFWGFSGDIVSVGPNRRTRQVRQDAKDNPGKEMEKLGPKVSTDWGIAKWLPE
jgi:hypothetical protein